MASARIKAEADKPPPTDKELLSAIESWRATAVMAQEARALEENARRTLVDVLHRAGIKGLVL